MSFPIACTLPEAVVTVVMPSYNHSKYVVDAIESVRQQTLQNWRLLIRIDMTDHLGILAFFTQNIIILYPIFYFIISNIC